MELKIPPPFVFLLANLLMLLTLLIPVGQLSSMIWLAMGLIIVGVVIGWLGIKAFQHAQTTISPVAPEKSSHLVVVGIYRVSRNPMYLSMALLLVGSALWIGTVWAWLGVIGFVLYINRFQIIPEERVLATKFGEAYQVYCRQTRRWL